MAIQKCPYCKAIIDDGAEFCSNCGTKLLFSEDEMIEEEIPGDKVYDEEVIQEESASVSDNEEPKPPKKRKPRKKKEKKVTVPADQAVTVKKAAKIPKKKAASPKDEVKKSEEVPFADEIRELEKIIEQDEISAQKEIDEIDEAVGMEITEEEKLAEEEPAQDPDVEPELDAEPDVPEEVSEDPVDLEPVIDVAEDESVPVGEVPEAEEIGPDITDPSTAELADVIDEDKVELDEDGFPKDEVLGPEGKNRFPATDDWDVDEFIREGDGEANMVPTPEEPPPEDQISEEHAPESQEELLSPDEELDFTTKDRDKMSDSAEKEEIEKFLDSLKKERREIKEKHGEEEEGEEIPSFASVIQDVSPLIGEEPPEVAEPPLLDEQAEIEEPPEIAEPQPDEEAEERKPFEFVLPTQDTASALPETVDQPSLTFNKEPEEKSDSRPDMFAPMRRQRSKPIIPAVLKARLFDVLFIAVLWFAALLIASRVLANSVLLLISESFPAAGALFLIMLGFYFFFFMFFLGETIGNQLFSHKE